MREASSEEEEAEEEEEEKEEEAFLTCPYGTGVRAWQAFPGSPEIAIAYVTRKFDV